MNRGVSSGGRQSSLNYLFKGGEAPKPALKATQAALAANNISAAKPDLVSPLIDVTKQIHAGTSVTRKESRALNEAKKRRVDKGIVVSERRVFIRKNGNMSEESLGCEYFEELKSRLFFQPSTNDKGLYIMHDLINGLAKSVAGEFFIRLDAKTGVCDRVEALVKFRHFSAFN
nr:hypothetical protein [Tanacetum cinerariifolium]